MHDDFDQCAEEAAAEAHERATEDVLQELRRAAGRAHQLLELAAKGVPVFPEQAASVANALHNALEVSA